MEFEVVSFPLIVSSGFQSVLETVRQGESLNVNVNKYNICYRQ